MWSRGCDKARAGHSTDAHFHGCRGAVHKPVALPRPTHGLVNRAPTPVGWLEHLGQNNEPHLIIGIVL